MKRLALVAVMMFSAAAMAEDVKLTCPAGSSQIGGSKSPLLASVCAKTGADGSRIFHGPYVSYLKNGQIDARGQYEEGTRVGNWTFFDQNGVKTGETQFKQGSWHGARTLYYPNGKVQQAETYNNGKQLTLARFDANGASLPIVPVGKKLQ